jgi:hypothetical protein
VSTSNAVAHCFVGARFFPATLAIDDPCVADEMSSPTVSWSKTADVPPGNSYITTGTVNPGVIWVGGYFQVGLEAVIPINRESGSGVGVLGQLHL